MPQTRTYDEFMALYNPDGTHPVTEIEVSTDDERNTSPFIIIRQGDRAVLVNPLAFEEYLDIDVHSFVDGKDATAAVLGMSDGYRYAFEPVTKTTSNGWPSVHLAVLIVGDQGTR
jgi:hypothetical protein